MFIGLKYPKKMLCSFEIKIKINCLYISDWNSDDVSIGAPQRRFILIG